MEFKFKRSKKLVTAHSVKFQQPQRTAHRTSQIFVSYCYTKLTYIYQLYSGASKRARLQLLNGPLMSVFNEYSRVLRKSMLPWLCGVRLAKTSQKSNMSLILIPFSLRHRNVLRSITKIFSLTLKFRWTSPYYRARRIKRWLSKKYTNRLWR